MATESMRVWNFSLSESVTCPASSRASTMAGMSRQATTSQRATSAPAHELRQQRHAVAGRQLAVEVVGDAEDGVVDEDLDVLAEPVAVPEGIVQLGEARAESLEERADGGARRQRLLEHAPGRAVAAHEARGPPDDLDRRRGHRSVRRGRSDSLRNSPRIRRRFTRSSYDDVRMMRSNWAR